MITSLCWVPRGVLQAVPIEGKATQEEMDAVAAEMEMQRQDEMDELPQAPQMDEKKSGSSALMKELNLDNYDNEGDAVEVFVGGSNLTVFKDNNDDPYITMEHADEDSDEEEAMIRNTDLVLLAGHTEEEYSSVEMHVFDKERSALYVHHDLALKSFPLAVAYLQTGDGKEKDPESNFLAVGTFEPAIEIWNLDVVNAVGPAAVLGGREAPAPFKARKGGKKRSAKKKNKRGLKDMLLGKLKKGSHKLGVLALDWNLHNRACIASGSADKTVKLWDVPKTMCSNTFHHHMGKVQVVSWNPEEAPILLTGGYDKTCACIDVRDAKSVRQYAVDGEVQSLSWNPANPAIFAASMDTGNIMFYDVRKTGNQTKPIFTIGAHDGDVTSVCFNAKYDHLLASASIDKTVKLWDLKTKPKCIEKKDLDIGRVFAAEFNRQDPDILAAGGDSGKVAIWDITSSHLVASQLNISSTDSKSNKK
ncbi:hypothetical protein AAMO2058_000732200 [Amorphochlora amoebiformis]